MAKIKNSVSIRLKNIIVSMLIALMALQVVGASIVDFCRQLHYQYQHYRITKKETLQKLVVSVDYWNAHLNKPKKNEIIINGDYYDVKSFAQHGDQIAFIAKKDKTDSVFSFIKNKIFSHEKSGKTPHKPHPPKYAQLYFSSGYHVDFQKQINLSFLIFIYKKNTGANYADGVFHPPIIRV